MPRTDLLAGYASVVSCLIEVFATCLGSDELVVYRNLVGPDRDVVRVLSTETDGSVALDVRIVAEACEMPLVAACAARSPQPAYRPQANKEASDYMRRLRLGRRTRKLRRDPPG